MEGKELGKLRKQGVEITDSRFEKKFAFMGDTTIDVFKDPKNSELLKTPVIMVECTALDDLITPATARERGHTHCDELEPIVRAHPDITFILIHFSRSYKEDFIVNMFENVQCNNVVLWLPNKVVKFAND
jgi:ribonuclease BN (tRNA processing enzyme)